MSSWMMTERISQKLLNFPGELDDSGWESRELDYVAACRIEQTDVPQLINVAKLWADEQFHDGAHNTEFELQPIIAWRILGQLSAVEAIEPLLELMNVLDADDDGWFLEEFPQVFALIGEPAIQPLAKFMADVNNLEFARTCAADAIKHIGKQFPERRNEAVSILATELRTFRVNAEGANALLVAYLLDLNAVEEAETIEKAHSLDVVDVIMCGTWDDVRSQLGVEGIGLPMPEVPYHGIRTGLSSEMATLAAQQLFSEDELNFEALEQQNEILARLFEESAEFNELTHEYRDWPATFLEIAANYCGVSFLDIDVRDANEVIFEIFPRKVSTPAESAKQIIDELHQFFCFVHREFKTLHAKTIAKSLSGSAAKRLHTELADSSNFGIAKSMWSQGSAAGFDMTSETDLTQFIELYNDSLDPVNAGDNTKPLTMTADEKKAFNKKRKKQLARKQAKKKRKR